MNLHLGAQIDRYARDQGLACTQTNSYGHRINWRGLAAFTRNSADVAGQLQWLPVVFATL
jgi:hypothetical protein